MLAVLLTCLLTAPGRLAARANRDERGSIVEWMILAIVAVAVMVVLSVAMPDLTQKVLDFIESKLGV